MARQHVRTPASKGGSASVKKHDEFTWDEFLDDIANRRQEQSESSQRSKSFSDVFKSILRTPQEYTEAQDKSYRQNQAVADFLKGIPMPSKEYPEGQDPFWGYENGAESEEGARRMNKKIYDAIKSMGYNSAVGRNVFDPRQESLWDGMTKKQRKTGQ